MEIQRSKAGRPGQWRPSLWPAVIVPLLASTVFAQERSTHAGDTALDQQLQAVLAAAGFTGRIEATLESRLGRHMDPAAGRPGAHALV